MTAKIDLLPLHDGDWWPATPSEMRAEMQAYARANVEHAVAPLQAEIEALRAEVREAREFRDKLVKAIGNEQLRAFIEKYGEPVPLTNRVQAAEARTERLAEALRELEEREQRDEALLRQALEALDSDHSDVQLRTAIALRERLGEGEPR